MFGGTYGMLVGGMGGMVIVMSIAEVGRINQMPPKDAKTRPRNAFLNSWRGANIGQLFLVN